MAKAKTILMGIINDLEQIVPKVAQEIGSELIELTPKDTTHAVENWQTAINGKNTDIIGEYPGHGGGVSVAELNMFSAINSFNSSKDSFIRFDMNVHYFQYLDDGWSTDARDGVTDPAVNKGIKIALNRMRF